ncbi:FtsK/SpoIIIE domain-containing protein [Streptomyces litchfieldiae]|uniref:FtsK/SpoIIIE domain-containing protein n=1 Tax=Streptomyces litchfieldiae TaxID=3075543 RepID=A0ABU2N428_9ACTN|nr:FtsK/SpoIIIE domain-containing protein [Streptomyces sp. DSM 44938]MDT0347484.1 FtsK/SpoIIIE domain-containing protein [Streptomyces sp. DSM 44938]
MRWRRPAWYWRGISGPVAAVRLRVRWGSVMEACELVVAPTRFRLTVARMAHRPAPAPRVPRLVRLRVTRTGLVGRVRLRPGQDTHDFATAADRLRHSFAMQQVVVRELRAGVVELRMTGYDVLRRVQMPRVKPTSGLRVPMALREDGSVHWRDYRQTPHALNLGATQSGKSVYQRRLVMGLAKLPNVALVGVDCKEGVELAPLARRFSALVDNPDDALALLEALLGRMAETYQVIRAEQRITADVPDAEITADIWGLPEEKRPALVVVVIDEIAELSLVSSGSKEEEKRRDQIITALVRLAQLGRAAGIYLELCGQRFGADLGKGITTLRAQLSGRVSHRVNDEGTAKMAFGDIAPGAVLACMQIPDNRPGAAVVASSSGGWSMIRTPKTSMRAAANVCNAHADLTPDIPELARWRPSVAGISLAESSVPAVSEAA